MPDKMHNFYPALKTLQQVRNSAPCWPAALDIGFLLQNSFDSFAVRANLNSIARLFGIVVGQHQPRVVPVMQRLMFNNGGFATRYHQICSQPLRATPAGRKEKSGCIHIRLAVQTIVFFPAHVQVHPFVLNKLKTKAGVEPKGWVESFNMN